MQLICTYCGRYKKLTEDHVFPRCLFVSPSNERPVKVKSCADCNGKSDEGLLKSFMVAMDQNVWSDRLSHFNHSKGKADLRKFLSTCVLTEAKQLVVYPEAKITTQWKKVFIGLRKHLLKNKWSFVEASRFKLYKIDYAPPDSGFTYRFWPLPLTVGGPNEAFYYPNELNEGLTVFDNKFRDFSYGIKDAGDENEMVIGLKYQRDEFNTLIIFCYVLPTIPLPVEARS